MDVTVDGNVTVRGNVDIEGVGRTILTPHDALYSRAKDMDSNGVYDGDASTVAGIPRWSLGANERVKGVFEIPVGWDFVDIRIWQANPSATAGTVIYSFNYTLYYPLLGTDTEDAGTSIAFTVNANGSAQNDSHYIAPPELDAIATATEGFFQTKPVIRYALTRTGGTLAVDIDIVELTCTRAE